MIVSQTKTRLRIFCFFVSLALFFSLSESIFAGGILDSAFGSGGVTTTDLGSDAAVHSLLAQPDGKIIVIAKNNGKYVLLRYNVNGTLDPNFGVGGKIVTSYDSTNAKVSVNILSNGLFAVGNQSSVVRYSEAGNLISSATFPAADLAAFRPDGKIVTAALINNPGACQGSHAKAISYKVFGENGGSELSSGLLCGIGTYGLQSLVDLVPNPDNTVYLGALNLALNAGGGFIYLISDSSSNSFQTPGGIIGFNFIALFSQADSRFVSLSNRGIIRGRTSSQPIQVYNFSEFGLTSMPYARVHGDDKVAALRSNESLLVLNSDFTFGGIASTNLYFAGAAEQNSVFVQTDDKIIVAGQVAAANGQKNIRLIRFSDVFNSAVPNFDYDADKKGDLTVFRQSNAVWFSQRSAAGFSAVRWGLPTDAPAPADYDGDGKFDYAVFRPSEGNWYILLSSNNQFRAVHFGQNGDRPLAADYDGDGRADLAVFRDGVWFFLDSSNNQFRAVQFGLAGDKTVPADYDSDGRADIAVYRAGVWYWLQSSDNAFRAVQFGIASDKPAVGDYDGDGQADQAVYRSGIWYVNRSRLGFYAVAFGTATDVPVPADYDGDGQTDIALFRNGVWYLLRSSQGNAVVQFGLLDDIPITANN